MHKFLLIGRGVNQGWWLLVDNVRLYEEVHKSVTSGLFLKFLENPHFEKAYPGQNAVILAQKWLQTAEKLFQTHSCIIVNRAGGMMSTRKLDSLDIIEIREGDTLRFPTNDIEKRRITISRWYGGKHFYLQSQHQLVFSKEKYDTLDEAMQEARAYALEANIHVADSFEYTRDGD